MHLVNLCFIGFRIMASRFIPRDWKRKQLQKNQTHLRSNICKFLRVQWDLFPGKRREVSQPWTKENSWQSVINTSTCPLCQRKPPLFLEQCGPSSSRSLRTSVFFWGGDWKWDGSVYQLCIYLSISQFPSILLSSSFFKKRMHEKRIEKTQ